MTQPNTQLYKPSTAEIPECFELVFRNSLEGQATSMLDESGAALYERGFRPQLEDEKHYWVRAARQTGQLALLFVGVRWLSQYGDVNYIDSFFAAPEARGTRPIRDVLATYRQEFADPLLPTRMHTALVNQPVRLLANKLGFYESGEPTHYGDGLPMTLWERAPEMAITTPTIEDAIAINEFVARMRAETYRNDAQGIGEEWVQAVYGELLSPEAVAERQASLRPSGDRLYRIVKNAQGDIAAIINGAKRPDGTELNWLFIDESLQGKGVGSRLHDEFMTWADHDKPIYLDVVTYNQQAIDFYHVRGFTITAENTHKYIVPTVVMTYQGETQ